MKHFNRDYYTEKAKENLAIVEAGQYKVNDKIIRLPNNREAKVIKNDAILMSEIPYKGFKISEANVLNESTVDTIFREGATNNGKIGVLNFASFNYPGGGFIRGAMAQEEALCQASNLYSQLKDLEVYTEHRRMHTNGLYNDDIIVTKTTFFRDSDFSLVENPVDVVVVTSAAPNFKASVEKNNSNTAKAIINRRIRKIILTFVDEGCKDIILGAFGCGVFENDPNIISWTFANILSRYGGYFNKITFSILGSISGNNYVAFDKAFNK